MQVGLLGPLVLAGDDGGELEVPRAPKERAVIEVLALRAGTVVRTSELVEALWADDPPPTAAKALQTYVSSLRRRFPVGSIRTDAGGYLLRVASQDVDAIHFERKVEDGRAATAGGDPEIGARLFAEALSLWRGDPLPDIADHAAAGVEAARLVELHRSAVESLADSRLRLGEHMELVGEIEAAVADEPFRERRWAQLMVALYRSGRQADALAAYQRMRRLLGDELGLEPSRELADLERAILRHDPTLDAPPARAPNLTGRRRGNLPAAISSFIGRARELQEVTKLLDERRLVTIIGAGGTGKTRVAVRAASQVADRFDDGVWFVDLSAADRPEDVPAAFTAAMGVHYNSDRPCADVLADYVTGQKLLLVVDNCEQVIEAASKMVERLLLADERLRALATSRELLRIPGEVAYRLSPLGLPAPADDLETIPTSESVRLFVERAQDADPTLELDSKSVATIDEIVRTLDGLPLAIELAAALVETLSLPEIHRSLDDRLALLTRGSRTAPARQQTLAATIDWSYRLLTANEQQALRYLSVFAGSFSLNAAIHVLSRYSSNEEQAREMVWSLFNKSLLARFDHTNAGRRYRLLETTREYAHQRLLEWGEQPAADEAFIDFFFTLAGAAESRLATHEQSRTLADLRAEHDNLRRAARLLSSTPAGHERALSMLTALHRYWLVRGDHAEWLQLTQPLTEVDDGDVTPALMARSLAAQCFIGSSFAPVRARPWGLRALEIARQTGNLRAECEACTWLAINGLFSGTPSLGLSETALALARQLDDPVLIGQGLAAVAYSNLVDKHKAVELSLDALVYLRASGDHLFEVFTLNNLGVIYERNGDLDQSIAHTEQALLVANRIGYPFPIGLANLAEFHIRQGHAHLATTHLNFALQLARRHSARDMLVTFRMVACLATALANWTDAAELYGYFATTWTNAGFEASLLDDSFVTVNLDQLHGTLGDDFDLHYSAGATLNTQQAFELAEQILQAAPPSPVP